jgi:AcrR family transcriptional regulator
MAVATDTPIDRQARRRARVVKRLIAVVEDLLREESSYLELKVEDIIQRGEMARSTFYSYFDDKADLLIALSDTATTDILRAAQGIWELPADATHDQVAAAVQHTIETYLPHTRLMTAMVEVATYNTEVRDRFHAAYARAQKAATEHIQAGQAAGFIRPELPPEETAGWLTWMAERGMHELVQHANRAQLRRLEASFTAILWFTLYHGQGRPEH